MPSIQSKYVNTLVYTPGFADPQVIPKLVTPTTC